MIISWKSTSIISQVTVMTFYSYVWTLGLCLTEAFPVDFGTNAVNWYVELNIYFISEPNVVNWITFQSCNKQHSVHFLRHFTIFLKVWKLQPNMKVFFIFNHVFLKRLQHFYAGWCSLLVCIFNKGIEKMVSGSWYMGYWNDHWTHQL